MDLSALLMSVAVDANLFLRRFVPCEWVLFTKQKTVHHHHHVRRRQWRSGGLIRVGGNIKKKITMFLVFAKTIPEGRLFENSFKIGP